MKTDIPNYQQIRKDRILALWGRDPRDLDDLGHCAIAVLNAQPNVDRFKNVKTNKKVKVVGLKWDIQHHTQVSNSHDCPINGFTNWSTRDASKPTGYPGWRGRVWVRYAEPIHSFGSNPWEETLLHTGTGGFGSYEGPWRLLHGQWYNAHRRNLSKPAEERISEPQIYSWDFRFFDEDWPELAEVRQIGPDTTWALLNDQRPPAPTHVFEWHDPKTQDADREFLLPHRKTK